MGHRDGLVQKEDDVKTGSIPSRSQGVPEGTRSQEGDTDRPSPPSEGASPAEPGAQTPSL